MSLVVQKEGILTTLQDLGRKSFQRYGINSNGVMDKIAVRLINILLGNDENEAVLEIHFPADSFLFEQSIFFALGGADFSAELNGETIKNWRVYFAEAGSILKFTKKNLANRAYLSVMNGFDIKSWLNSKSTNLLGKIGGFEGRKLKKGDVLKFNSSFSRSKTKLNRIISNSLIPFYSKLPTVRIIKCAEFEQLNTVSIQILQTETFQISNDSNRMGFRLNGKKLCRISKEEILSSAVNFGTIQLLPDGNLVVLMADRQTSGGYPRIANVISTDLPLISQLGANDKVGFHIVSLQEAEDLSYDFERNLNLLKIACKFHWQQ